MPRRIRNKNVFIGQIKDINIDRERDRRSMSINIKLDDVHQRLDNTFIDKELTPNGK